MARRPLFRWLAARWTGRTLALGPIRVRLVRGRTWWEAGRTRRPVGRGWISRRLVLVRTGRQRVRGRRPRRPVFARTFPRAVFGRRRRLGPVSRPVVVVLRTTCGPATPRIRRRCATASSRTRGRPGRRLNARVRRGRIGSDRRPRARTRRALGAPGPRSLPRGPSTVGPSTVGPSMAGTKSPVRASSAAGSRSPRRGLSVVGSRRPPRTPSTAGPKIPPRTPSTPGPANRPTSPERTSRPSTRRTPATSTTLPRGR